MRMVLLCRLFRVNGVWCEELYITSGGNIKCFSGSRIYLEATYFVGKHGNTN